MIPGTSVERVQHASRRAQTSGHPGQCQDQHKGTKSTRIFLPAQYGFFPSEAIRDVVLHDHRRSYRRVSRHAGNHGIAHRRYMYVGATELPDYSVAVASSSIGVLLLLVRSFFAMPVGLQHTTTHDPRHAIHDTRSTRIFGDNKHKHNITTFEVRRPNWRFQKTNLQEFWNMKPSKLFVT